MAQKSNLNHIKNCIKNVEEWLYERNIDFRNMSEEDRIALNFYIESLDILNKG